MSTRDLVLVGGGHTHALVIRRLAMKPMPDVRITLVSESGLTPYSGMLPGLVAGHYRPDEIHIDLNRLCRWAGVRFIQGRLSGFDPELRRLHIEGQPELHYDKVSFDTGSTPDLSIPGAREHAVGVKPISHFYPGWLELLAEAEQGREGHWGVVGAGAGGVELVLAMAYRLRSSRIRLHLIFPGQRILSGHPEASIRAAETALAEWGVECHPQFTVARVEEGGLVGANGDALALDQTIWCTSAAAPDWSAESGLEAANGGFIAVNPHLQSCSHPDVFAAGDVAEMVKDKRPKAGVYAVRQAPTLYENLDRSFRQQPLKPLRLQRSFLSLLSLGEQRAVGHRGRLVVKGRWVWRWKNRIDRAFMRKLTDLGEPMAMAEAMPSQMHCAGCGSKLGPALLSETLSRLPRAEVEGLQPALGQAEDASLWQPTPGRTQLQSLDGFRAFSEDLYRFGQVCVHHALSDLYAMGAEAKSAQVWVNLAHNHPRLQKRDFRRLMTGIADALARQKVGLAGGHSTEGRETHVAIVANGELEPGKAWRKNGARPGDYLVLTKPLGTGLILAAEMSARAPYHSLEAAWESMLTSNQGAAEVLREAAPSAVTDVTGFGLLGHLLEMLADNDSLQAQLDARAVPALDGALELIRAGFQSSLYPQLEPYTLQTTVARDVPGEYLKLMLDPQTSGGLLIAIPPDQWARIETSLPQAAVIGRIGERSAQSKAVAIS